MMQICVGKAGLSLAEFWDAEIWEIKNIIKGHYEGLEDTLRQEWVQSRYLAFFITSPWTKKIKKPEDLGLFPWEKEKARANKKAIEDRIRRLKEMPLPSDKKTSKTISIEKAIMI